MAYPALLKFVTIPRFMRSDNHLMPRLLLIWLVIALPASGFAQNSPSAKDDLTQKQLELAASEGSELLKSEPENSQLRFQTALSYQKTHQADKAEQHYLYLIKNHPELPEPRNNLAIIYQERGQYEEAAGLLIASLKTHPSYAVAWKNLSDLYKGLASEAYRKALGEEQAATNVLETIQLSAIDQLYSLPKKSSPVRTPEVTVASISIKPSGQNDIQTVKLSPKPQDNPSRPVEVKTTSADLAITLDTADTFDPVQALHNWASAWSDKDIETYINAYIEDFKGREKNHQKWVNQRQQRITKPGKINVTLSNITIKSRSETEVSIDAEQHFKSPNYQDKVVKRFKLTNINGIWKISRESTIAVL